MSALLSRPADGCRQHCAPPRTFASLNTLPQNGASSFFGSSSRVGGGGSSRLGQPAPAAASNSSVASAGRVAHHQVNPWP